MNYEFQMTILAYRRCLLSWRHALESCTLDPMKKIILHRILLLALLPLFLQCGQKETKTPSMNTFYVGTYTQQESQGIYEYILHENGQLEQKGLVAKSDNPSFLAKSADGNYLLAVNEVNTKDSIGFVESFRIQKDSLILIDKESSGGAHPCHINLNTSGQVLTANYTGGNMGLLQLMQDGSLSDLLDVQQHFGNGGTERQQGPHAHSAWFSPYNGDIISVDLGTNSLWFSRIDQEKKIFLPQAPPTLQLPQGAGPRHLVFHPTEEWIYVVNELSNTVTQLVKENDSTAYTIIAAQTTLPKDYTEPSFCADIRISADGKFVYVSNRGHNSIAIFAVDQKTGALEVVGHEATRGDHPRNFSLSPDGRYLLVANQNTNNIVSFKRDKNTGLLEYADTVDAPTPVCILF